MPLVSIFVLILSISVLDSEAEESALAAAWAHSGLGVSRFGAAFVGLRFAVFLFAVFGCAFCLSSSKFLGSKFGRAHSSSIFY